MANVAKNLQTQLSDVECCSMYPNRLSSASPYHMQVRETGPPAMKLMDAQTWEKHDPHRYVVAACKY